ncbi:TIR domain-containing protein [Clostridium botulinum]|nr:TIR domain-containing protein [Clostridium botulinum]NFJ41423.1 TIR domain-containing protein [Clostridium botulinum B str. Eklund 17B (NRP)]MBY6999813.1 TIR domain-containing protein [Clostridium botulinum]NFD71641.1 TIR domain-containing protein [Clostridium botulinum]NFF33501.1 TIR domain-containing protein [Clostridium botulinum]
MRNLESAGIFYSECKEILDTYVANKLYISSVFQINQLLTEEPDKNDILIFFNSENGIYNEGISKLVNKYYDAQSRIWPIAMENNAECRRPPSPVSAKQSFDVYCRNENRNPMKNNMKAIAQIFARKIISQTLSPLYRDEVLYFISHRRIDGENIAARLADELKSLTRERNVYRDVVNVEVGNDTQEDIDENLELSDVVIFLQTKESQNSSYIMKELCYAIINDIPILWIQIDNASYSEMGIRPGEAPVLSYSSEEFFNRERLLEIVDEIEVKCFQLMMNTSNQVFSYIEYFNDMSNSNKIKLVSDKSSILAYQVQYEEKTRDLYDLRIRNHYVQCFGRNPKPQDIQQFREKVIKEKIYENHDRLFLLSNHGRRDKQIGDAKLSEENFDNYLMNIENVSGGKRRKLEKRIILSGAFPDCDEIYKNSLLEAVVVYSREIIKRGYILVFGAHPTFQKLIFDIGKVYASDIKYSIEMHMDKAYLGSYNLQELQEKCTLVLSDGLQEMRENMICKEKSEMLICLGGKVKEDKTQQGVDIEVELAKSVGIPVALVGTVGGRSSEYAFEMITESNWDELNSWDTSLNESLFYNVNHRVMVKRLLDLTEGENEIE